MKWILRWCFVRWHTTLQACNGLNILWLCSVWIFLAASPLLAQGTQTGSMRIDQMQATGVLRVCVWPAYYAITFRNPRNGETEGIDIDLARAFAADLGLTVQFIDSSFTAFLDDLEADRCDIAMFGIGITPNRARRASFSAPYLKSGIFGVTTKVNRRILAWDDVDKPGVVVAVQAGTYMVEAMRSTLRHAETMTITPPATREAEVESGRADVLLCDYPYARRMVFQHPWARIIEPSEPVWPTPYAYAVKPGDSVWLERVNQFVRTIKSDGRLHAAARKHDLLPIVAGE